MTRATAAAATSGATGSIDFRRDKDGAGHASLPSSTIRTAPRASRCCTTRMARSATSSRPSGLHVGDHGRVRRRAPTSSRATRCRCGRSRSVRWCTTSSSSRDAADRWRAAPGVAAQLMAKEGALRAAEVALRRAAVRADRVPRDRRAGRQPRARELSRSARPAATRWKGRRSRVRGIAMNPVDHPHGGGEGRSKGNHPQSPWGQPAKGYRTRHNRRTDRYIVKRRSK